MSQSNPTDTSTLEHELDGGEKRRRLGRACDLCRKKKIRCDGSEKEAEPCSTCIDARVECTFVNAASKRTPQRSTYIASLETRLQAAEEKIKQLRGELTAAHISGDSSIASVSASTSPNSGGDAIVNDDTTQPQTDPFHGSIYILRATLQSVINPPAPPSPEDVEDLGLIRQFVKVHVGTQPDETQFIGRSSGIGYVHAAMSMKADVERREGTGPTMLEAKLGRTRRMQFWDLKPSDWENPSIRTHDLVFPPLALILELTDLYFAHVNIYLPLLHRPTFEKGLQDALFLQNDHFASVVLLVCAVASRWHPDPQIGAPGGTGTGLEGDPYGPGLVSPAPAYRDATGSGACRPPRPSFPTAIQAAQAAALAAAKGEPGAGLACGWAWFDQVPPVGSHMFSQTTLWGLQYYALAFQFLERTASPHICWNIIGTALRLAQVGAYYVVYEVDLERGVQDLGIHRRSARVEPPTVEREQLKRAFWVLLYQDRLLSSGMGRQCVLQYEDFDIDLPIECDDEYWEHPTHPFQQPRGKPSRITFFNTIMGLNHVLALSLKVIYSLGKYNSIFRAFNASWAESVVAELDSALNIWREKVPEHLKWDPDRLANPVFFDQSVALQCGYYYVQILIHRPFVPILRREPTALPALALCTSAARACANIVDLQLRRKGDVPIAFNFYPVFSSAIILLLNIWSSRRAGLSRAADTNREMGYVEKCMHSLKVCEDRWQHAGMLWDTLAELAVRHEQRQQQVPNLGLRVADSGGPRASETTLSSFAPGTEFLSNGHTSPRAFEPPVDVGFSPFSIRLSPGADPELEAETENEMFLDQIMYDMDPQTMALMDPQTMALWTNAPLGLEVGDWEQYFGDVGLPQQQLDIRPY
ncbi:hypothetical protein HMN09_00139700 [Mycena chlorophos]|uniref:Zn(2)-C6 fungal-type domain-containing protein n=1 Tax=Mycena chlorophos TaxID=658473 RepID=A0A8H6TPP7_MYCCL|nr:hypothetical protein HMN09_00139700 [Mycena chlorophos]